MSRTNLVSRRKADAAYRPGIAAETATKARRMVAACLAAALWSTTARAYGQAETTNPLLKALADSLAAHVVYTTVVTSVPFEPQLFFDYSANAYALLTANLKFEDKVDKQKLNFALLKLRRDLTRCGWECETTLNLVRTKDNATFGVALGYNSGAYYSGRMSKILKSLTVRSKEPGEDLETYKRTVLIPKVYSEAFERLGRNAFFIGVGANIQTFGTFGGTKVDLDGDGKVDNEHTVKAWDIGPRLTYSLSPRTMFVLSGHLTHKRASAAEGQALGRHYGGSLSFQHMVKKLDPGYETSEAYLTRLFVPALILGTAVEYQSCTADLSVCEERTARQLVATPFLDVKLTPEAQFRLGLPVRWRTTAGKTATEAQPLLGIGFQLAGL